MLRRISQKVLRGSLEWTNNFIQKKKKMEEMINPLTNSDFYTNVESCNYRNEITMQMRAIGGTII